MIRKALDKDIEAILSITQSCAKQLIELGIFQWSEAYPDKLSFEKDIERGELYVLELDYKIIGCVTITTLVDEAYKPVKWLTRNDNNIYIHRLAVLPEFQRRGYARKLMDFAEDRARTEKKRSIRLDTFSQNLRNQRFYEQRGYKRLEKVYFPNQSEHPFYCYELPL
ncbi:MAG: GNAT family N-acetyltransferase [Flavobacteriaceae bacterium]|nr:GNAT family N-acetyltransferase [Flavobacteriaceae bacterium]